LYQLRIYAITASMPSSFSGPPRFVDHADIVEPVRPFAIASRSSTSLAEPRKPGWLSAGAASAL
jgi:hypothetical protein